MTGAAGYFGTRIRVEQSSRITALVKVGELLDAGSTHIKMSAGGYGTQHLPRSAQ